MPKKVITISGTSEKTIEVNVLADIIHYIEENYKRKVTIISPTQNQEIELGFDASFEGLPLGRVVFLQFKRPYAYSARHLSNFARFYLDHEQQRTLLGNFYPTEAYYVFVPLPTISELVATRMKLLQVGVALDIHDVPNPHKGQKSRTVKVTKSGLTPHVEVADPRIYQSANAISLESFCERIGSETPLITSTRRHFMEYVRRDSYLIHVSGEHQG